MFFSTKSCMELFWGNRQLYRWNNRCNKSLVQMHYLILLWRVRAVVAPHLAWPRRRWSGAKPLTQHITNQQPRARGQGLIGGHQVMARLWSPISITPTVTSYQVVIVLIIVMVLLINDAATCQGEVISFTSSPEILQILFPPSSVRQISIKLIKGQFRNFLLSDKRRWWKSYSVL